MRRRLQERRVDPRQGEQGASVLLSTREGPVLRLTLNRPEARNSLSEEMLQALQSALDAASSDAAVRAIVIAATGTAFSAGHDMREITTHRGDPDGGRAYYAWLMEICCRLMQGLTDCPKPVIAEVKGVATAAGCQLVAGCDLAIAAKSARFATPGVNIGLFCSTPMVALSRNVAAKHAMEMLLTGDLMDAEHAAAIGLVNRVVPDEALTRETMALAAKVASKSAAVVRLGKAAFYRQRTLPLAEAYAHCSAVMVDNLLMQDAKEGLGAFLEKRTPRWEDR